MAEEDWERKFFSSFEKHGEFLKVQTEFLQLDLAIEPSKEQLTEDHSLYKTLTDILNEYQEQSYLLDPYLEELVVPVVEKFKSHAKDFLSNSSHRGSSGRIRRLAMLLYSYIKVRGPKTITRFFPHEVADLWIVLGYLNLPESFAHEPGQWALRYVSLLWLSLVCMIPFDLSQFDEGEDRQTSRAIESVTKQYLPNAGLEREGAAIVLSRFYMRKDTSTQFTEFIEWAQDALADSLDLFSAIGVLHVLCEILKSGPLELFRPHLSGIESMLEVLDKKETLILNTVIRKLKTKLISRIGLRLLPGKSSARRAKGRFLSGDAASHISEVEEDAEVPEEVESVLEQLFAALQDKDTLVRWSAAKGVARIAERLPSDLADQVLETVLGHFAIHSLAAANLYDVPAIAEATWHGACLACAEMSRRGVVSSDRLPELVGWLSKALYFDVRKGAHSVGANVRDAGAYVLWALARSQSVSSLAPLAGDLARNLVTVSLYDREIQIRRAASAGFQEFVGRTSLFPHGIDVLRKTDFYAVGIRRNAFLVAAPQVAEHIEYRSYLLDHLLNVSLRHWDISMRRIGAQSLRLICLADMPKLGSEAIQRCAKLLGATDSSDVHGGLLGLTELALSYQEIEGGDVLESRKRDLFRYLSQVPESTLLGPRHEIVTAAACDMITQTITLSEINMGAKSSVPNWRKIVDHGLKHRDMMVQEAATITMGAISKLVDYSSKVASLPCTLIQELKKGSFTSQQSLGRLLGVIDYESFPACLPQCIDALLEGVNRSSGPFRANVEARKTCYEAMPLLLDNIANHLSQHVNSGVVLSMFDALLDGLDDYTVDERGDVGSWIRIACVNSLTTIIETLILRSKHIEEFESYLPPPKYDDAIRGILKQGVERLDNVRQDSGTCFRKLLRLPQPEIHDPGRWTVTGSTLMQDLFLNNEEIGWNDATWLFPRAVQILGIETYRKPVLLGLIASVGSLTGSTHRPVSASLVSYVGSLPLRNTEPQKYSLLSITSDLYNHAKANATANSVVIPTLQVFNVLLEGDAFRLLEEDLEGIQLLRQLLSMVSRYADRIKNVKRLLQSMTVLVHLLSFQELYKSCVEALPSFLSHQYPSIRGETAEFLYISLQSMDLGRDTEEAENVLLETEWSSANGEEIQRAANGVSELLLTEK